MGYFLTIVSFFFNTLIEGVAIHMVLSLAGIIFLGVPTVVKASLYALAIAEKAGIAPEISFIIALLVSIVVGLMFGFLFTRVSADSFAVLGMASMLALDALIKSTDKITNGVLGISGVVRPGWMSDLAAVTIVTVIVGLLCLGVEAILLQTPFGRKMRAFKEDEITLQSLGLNTKKFSRKVIVITSVFLSIAASLFLWRIQFLDANFGGVAFLVFILTPGILAVKPKLRYVVLGAAVVSFLPEILRFFQFPSSLMGYIRDLLYALFLILLVHQLHSRFITSRRTI
jgi:branched-chain amino acid transport system permease protein